MVLLIGELVNVSEIDRVPEGAPGYIYIFFFVIFFGGLNRRLGKKFLGEKIPEWEKFSLCGSVESRIPIF